MEIKEQYSWSRKSKTYKMKTFAALKGLYGQITTEETKIEDRHSTGAHGAGEVSCLDGKQSD